MASLADPSAAHADVARSALVGSASAFAGWFESGVAAAAGVPEQSADSNGRVYLDAPGLRIGIDPSRVACALGDMSVTLCMGRPRIDAGTEATAEEIAREIARSGG